MVRGKSRQQDRPPYAARRAHGIILPSPYAGPDGIALGPDGNVWFSESEISKIGRITPQGDITEFGDGITFGARPLSLVVRDGALWFSEAAGNRIGRITMDGKVTEYPIPSHDSQPRAMVTHPDGSIWFVETSTNALGRIDRDGRITEHPVPTPNASLRGVTVGADGDLWYTANFANKIGRMAPDGVVRGEYDIPTPNSGARCITALADGRLFFSQYDAGLIGEVVYSERHSHARPREGRDPAQRSWIPADAGMSETREQRLEKICNRDCRCFRALPAAALADDYPNHPIRMIVPISVGSITDVASRLTAQALQERLGQPVVVINKPGAAMVLGGSECAKSDPDGYTLCVVSPDTMSFNPLTVPNLPYDPTTFVPVIDMYHVSEGLMAPADLHVNTIEELHAKAVAESGKLNYGTLGERTTTDAFRQWLNEHWKTNFVAIPYKGGGEIIGALLENTIDVAKIGVGNMTSQLKEGRSRCWRCAPRSARRSLPIFPPSTKRVSALSPAARSSGAWSCRPEHRRPSSNGCTTKCWRSSEGKNSPTSPARTSSNRPPAQPRISPPS